MTAPSGGLVRTIGAEGIARTTDGLISLVLSWNRPSALRRTVESLRHQAAGPVTVAVVDNGSDEETVTEIHRLLATGALDAAWFHQTNLGGAAFNEVLHSVTTACVHFSENDLEYRPGWDLELLGTFADVPELGQLSVFGPEPERGRGEIWVDHEVEHRQVGTRTLAVTAHNVGTTSVVRTALLTRHGPHPPLRWENLVSGPFRWPNDTAFSAGIRRRGALVAWHHRYLATNWGHNVSEWRAHPEYYRASHHHKWWLSDRERERRLTATGSEGGSDGARASE